MCAAPRFRSLAGLTGRVSVTLALALTACAQDKKVGSAESSSPQPPTAVIAAPDEIPAEVQDEAAGSSEAVAEVEEEASAAEGEPAEGADVAGAEDSGAPTPAASAEAAEPEDEAADTPAVAEGKSKVLILGDSLAATGFGALLERRLDAHPNVIAYRKARSSSGLARPDFYDWMGEAKRQVDARTPDVVVVIIGGNDGQDLTNKSGKGKRVHWKSDGWSEAYRERVANFIDELRGEGRKVLWLGLPRTGTVSFEKKLNLIREVQINAMADYEDVEYFDTSPFFVDERGDLRRTADVGRKKNQALRADDGIHFTMAGAQYFADQVYPEVLRSLGVEDAAE